MKSIIIVLVLTVVMQQIPATFDYVTDINPNIIVSARYFTPGNFVGESIDGYHRNTAILTKQAAAALSKVQDECMKLGYSIVVYDAYRPQKAVDHFLRWSKQPEDFKTKQQFYPFINKEDILPGGYVAPKSGHSRGSTVDLTLISLEQKLHEVRLIETKLKNDSTLLYRDDGTMFTCVHFDFFGPPSHHDTDLVTDECSQKRNLLRKLMVKQGFKPLQQEWWHYTLEDEPFPNTYFDFDVI